MISRIRCRLFVALLLVVAMAPMATAQEKKRLAWRTDLDAARRDAVATNRPVLVRIGGEYCPWCKKLDEEIATADVQEELAHWSLVYLDLERSGDDAEKLNVSGIPALRVLTPQGRLLASTDGFLKSAELVEWLAKQREAVVQAPDELLLATTAPSVLEVVRIVRLFSDRDATVREAAVRRLAPHPTLAAAAVLKTLQSGNLAARLTAIDLLSQWQSPVDDVDPWRPETLTDQQIAALERWAADLAPEVAAQILRTLGPEQKKDAVAQIERMLKADATSAAAAREQLARFGAALMPEVLARLKSAVSDDEKQRLTALRYRLAAPADLPLRWPGGLERLASASAEARHRAADELAALATPEHEPLLLELFSDPDSLVREISLRGLKTVSAQGTGSALVKLLDDPEPNVRAAVLKQLAEDAPGELIAKVSAYAQREKDPDLIVHALRYFAEVKDRDVTSAVVPHIAHESWQVRAEVAHVLAKRKDAFRTFGHTDPLGDAGPQATGASKALMQLIEDPDPFVVSRALEGIGFDNSIDAIKPLMNAVERHPELATKVATILANNSHWGETAAPHLRRFLEHERASVRSAAITGLGHLNSDQLESEMLRALADRDRDVRIAAVSAIAAILMRGRPNEGEIAFADGAWAPTPVWEPDENTANDEGSVGDVKDIVKGILRGLGVLSPPAGANVDSPAPSPAPAQESTDGDGDDQRPANNFGLRHDTWLQELYQGRHRPAWMKKVVEALQRMLAADDPRERVAAAVVLIPLGRAEAALPVLMAAVQAHPATLPDAAAALFWLDWPRRVALLEHLDRVATDADQRALLLEASATTYDVRMADWLWKRLSDPSVPQSLAHHALTVFKSAYFGSRHYNIEQANARTRRQARDAILPHTTSGPPLARLLAIVLLMEFSADDVGEPARALLDDPTIAAEFHADVFQILLLSMTGKEQADAAVAAIQGTDTDHKRTAIRLLAAGPSALAMLPTSNIIVHVTSSASSSYGSGTPIVPEAPKHVKADDVRPLLSDPDPQVAAYAGYLLTLMDEPAGMPPLLSYWKSQAEQDSALDRLVYRAIAVTDDPRYLAELKQIAGRLQEYERREFYWTVRIMSGPEILRFRKELRDKYGMEQLR